MAPTITSASRARVLYCRVRPRPRAEAQSGSRHFVALCPEDGTFGDYRRDVSGLGQRDLKHFLVRWADRVRLPKERQSLAIDPVMAALQAYPFYVQQQFAMIITQQPVLAMCLFSECRLLPPHSLLRTDDLLQAELARNGPEAFKPGEFPSLERLTRVIYDDAVAHLYPSEWRPDSANDRMRWRSRLSSLPVLIVRALAHSIEGRTDWLALASLLGLSRLGIPE